MKETRFEFNYKVYDSIDELTEEKQALLKQARETTGNAYAPYSNFHVGAVAKMANGKIVTGSNQENASFPVGLCAERVLLASASSQYPNIAIDTIAISYNGSNHTNDYPISPCGVCRQTLQEYESRSNSQIKIILSGMTGEVYEIETAKNLLPLAFTSNELK